MRAFARVRMRAFARRDAAIQNQPINKPNAAATPAWIASSLRSSQ